MNFKKDGYILLKGFFNANEIRKIRKAAKQVFLNIFCEKEFIISGESKLTESEFMNNLEKLFQEDFATFQNCGKQIQHLMDLHRLCTSPKIEKQLKIIGLKTPNISTRPVLFFNHPNLSKEKIYHTMDYHQDWKSMQGSANSVVVWIPLMDITKEFGALKIIPGSHIQGLKQYKIQNGFGMVEISKNEAKKEIDVEVEIGDALFFSSFLIHSSGENIMNIPRWSTHFRYNDLDDNSFKERGYPHPYIYRPIDEMLTPQYPINKIIKNYYGR